MFDKLIANIALGVIRHLATAAGGWMVTQGIIDKSQLEPFLGSVLFLAGLAVSVADKLIAHKKLTAAQAPNQ